MTRERTVPRARGLGGFDVDDLVLQGAVRRRDLDRLALLLADDRLADRRLVRELLLARVRLRGADDRCTRSSCSRRGPCRRTRVPTPTTPLGTSSFSIRRARASRSSSWAIFCSTIACSFFASSYSEFSEMSPNSRACLIRSATSRRLSVRRVSSSCLRASPALQESAIRLSQSSSEAPGCRHGAGLTRP